MRNLIDDELDLSRPGTGPQGGPAQGARGGTRHPSGHSPVAGQGQFEELMDELIIDHLKIAQTTEVDDALLKRCVRATLPPAPGRRPARSPLQDPQIVRRGSSSARRQLPRWFALHKRAQFVPATVPDNPAWTP